MTMKRLNSILAYVAMSLLFALCFGFAQTVSGQDATTPSSSITCCSIRMTELELRPQSVRIVVKWIRSDGSTHEERCFAVVDGDTPETKWLWGTGVGHQIQANFTIEIN